MPTFIHKFFTACLSVITFSFIVAAFQVFFLHNELQFGLLLTIYTFYMTPIFIIIGIPISYIIDKRLKSDNKEMTANFQSYIRSLAYYGIAGLAVAMIYGSITLIGHGHYFFSFGESIKYIVTGLVGAFVYHSIALLLYIDWEAARKEYEAEQKAEGEKELKNMNEMY